jgi:hypothetical protein
MPKAGFLRQSFIVYDPRNVSSLSVSNASLLPPAVGPFILTISSCKVVKTHR